MDMEQNELRPEPEEERTEVPAGQDELTSVEKFYERFRGVSLRRLDMFIAACVGALVLVVLLGILDSRGIF